MTTFLTTTGISLLNNTKGKLKKKGIDQREPTADEMRQNLRDDAKRASAEANSLLRMANRDDHIILLHTQDHNASQCVELLAEYFIREGFKHVQKKRFDFQEDPKHIETTLLINFIDTLIREIASAQNKNQEVVINATAGFKALVVYSTMIGMIYQVPVKYIYEDFESVVTFSAVPIDWSISLFQQHEEFFYWIDDRG